jgi:flavin-dependent dehydrogenase
MSRQAGPIPLYSPGIKIQAMKNNAHFYLLGDAGCMIKNTTGGGIIQGLKTAKLLSEIILENKLDDYEKRFKKTIGKELYMHYLIHKTLNKFNDEDWNTLIEYFQDKKLITILENVDRDDINKLVLKLILKKPELVRFGGKLI